MSQQTIPPLAQTIRERTKVPFRRDEFAEVVCRSFTKRPGHTLYIVFDSTNSIHEFPQYGKILVPASWGEDVMLFLRNNHFHFECVYVPSASIPNEIYVSLYKFLHI